MKVNTDTKIRRWGGRKINPEKMIYLNTKGGKVNWAKGGEMVEVSHRISKEQTQSNVWR